MLELKWICGCEKLDRPASCRPQVLLRQVDSSPAAGRATRQERGGERRREDSAQMGDTHPPYGENEVLLLSCTE
jgi:hypothetical protein